MKTDIVENAHQRLFSLTSVLFNSNYSLYLIYTCTSSRLGFVLPRRVTHIDYKWPFMALTRLHTRIFLYACIIVIYAYIFETYAYIVRIYAYVVFIQVYIGKIYAIVFYWHIIIIYAYTIEKICQQIINAYIYAYI